MSLSNPRSVICSPTTCVNQQRYQARRGRVTSNVNCSVRGQCVSLLVFFVSVLSGFEGSACVSFVVPTPTHGLKLGSGKMGGIPSISVVVKEVEVKQKALSFKFTWGKGKTCGIGDTKLLANIPAETENKDVETQAPASNDPDLVYTQREPKMSGNEASGSSTLNSLRENSGKILKTCGHGVVTVSKYTVFAAGIAAAISVEMAIGVSVALDKAVPVILKAAVKAIDAGVRAFRLVAKAKLW